MLSSTLVLLLLLLVVGFASATPAFQQQVSLPNGVSAQVDWQVQDQDNTIFTIKVNTIDFGWLGFGVASSNGLGTDIVTGGPHGGGSIVAMKIQNQPVVREFALLPQFRFEPYSTEGIVLQDALDCISTFCQSESQSCFSQALCRNSLTCASSKFDMLPTNLTENSGPEVMDLVQDCINPLSNPEIPEQNKALSLLLNAGSCFASSCSAKMLEISTRRVNVNSTAFTQPGDGSSTLRVVLEQRQLARARFAQGSVHSFFVLLGEPFTGNVNYKTKLTPVRSQAVFVINLDTGIEERVAVPMWLMVHVALAVLGFAGVFALSLCMRRIKMRRHTWIPFTLAGMGIALGSVGAVVVSTIGQKSDPQDLHKVLSLIVIVLCVGVWIGGIYHQPNQTSSSSWRAVLARGRNSGESGGSFCMGVLPMMELVCLGGLAAACITGYTTVQASSIESKDLILAVIVGCGVCALSALLILVWPLVSALVSSTTTIKNKKQEVMQASSNPVFADLGPTTSGLNVAAVLPLTLSWNNLSFTSPARKGGGNGMPKPILYNAVGICPPRTLTCVLGPSGAGKSSLMDFLSSRNTHAPSSGTQLLVNGIPMENFPQLHRHLAMVPQSDVLHEHLTVLETLQFACEMILPQAMEVQDKVDHMLRIVAQLGMGHVLDTLVGGGSGVRGLSGGERRRVSIALQLVKSPSILFCDEPTSGLDAHMALKLCKVLRDLANEGRTVFATIHQPSVSCFELFDRLVVLSAGNTVYSGPRVGAMQFLQECNRGVPTTNWNEADWILTLVDFTREENDSNIVLQNGQVVEYRIDEKTEEILKRKKIHSQNKTYKAAQFDESSLNGSNAPVLRQAVFAYYAAVNPEKTKEDPRLVDEICTYTTTRGVDAVENKLKSRYGVSFLPFLSESMQHQPKSIEPCTKEELESIVAKFKASKFHAELVARIAATTSSKQDVLAQELTGQATMTLQEERDYAQPFMVQMRLLAERSFLLVWRNPQALRFQAAQNVVFGLLLGALYSNLKTLNSPFQVAFSMASILAMVAFVALSLGTQIAFNDKLVLEREISEAMYSPYAHFMQRIMVGIPVAVFVALCLILPAYFLIGLKMDGDAFFFFFLVNMAIVFVFDSIVFALTLIASNVNTAYAMGNFIEAMTIFFSGVFIPVYAMPSFLGWIYYLSPFSYAFGAVVQNEFLGTENEFVISLTGVVVPHPWSNLMIVFGMGVAWRLFGLFGIIRLFNRKRPGRKPKLV